MTMPPPQETKVSRNRIPTAQIEVAPSQYLPELLGLQAPNMRKLPVSQSLVTTMEFCPRKALLSYGFQLRRAGRAPAADKGSYAHRVIQAAVTPESETGGSSPALRGRVACETLLSELEKDQAAFYSSADAPSLDCIPPDKREKMREAMEIGYATGVQAAELLAQYRKSGLFSFEASELPLRANLRITLAGRRHPFIVPVSGQADITAVDRKGDVWILDLKTIDAKKAAASWAETANRRIQPWLYVNALRAMWPDRNVAGMLVLLVKRPSIKRKKNQTAADYLNEVQEWYSATGKHADKAEARNSDPAVQFLPLRVPPSCTPEMSHRLLAVRTQLRRPLTEWDWPTRETCERHNSMCSDAAICAGHEVPAVVVHRDYTTEIDPSRPHASAISATDEVLDGGDYC